MGRGQISHRGWAAIRRLWELPFPCLPSPHSWPLPLHMSFLSSLLTGASVLPNINTEKGWSLLRTCAEGSFRPSVTVTYGNSCFFPIASQCRLS